MEPTTYEMLAAERELDELDLALTIAIVDVRNIVSLGKLDRSPKKNWVEIGGGLPKYIEEIADSIHRKRGKSIKNAIQIAVGVVKRWAKGVGDVDPDTRAKAAAAVAQWEALKVKAKAKTAAKKAAT